MGVKARRACREEFGILVPVNDQAAMTQALQWMGDTAQQDHYRQRSGARIRHFSVEHAVAQYGDALKLPHNIVTHGLRKQI